MAIEPTATARAALFDLDGTLVDSEPRSRWAWTELFRAHGVPLDPATLVTFSGRRGQEVLAERLHLFRGHTVGELLEEAMSYWRTADMPVAAPVAGAAELVHQLRRQHVPMAVVTSGRRGDAEAMLDRAGVLALFDTLVAADDVLEGKPHPEGYLTACARLGVAPRDAVVFEDAPAGVEAAKAAGAYCVGVAANRPRSDLAGADLIVDDLTQVSWPPGSGTAGRGS